MDRIFAFLRVHVVAYLLFLVAFFAWKDYLSKPHQRVSPGALAHTTGPVGHFAGLASLPSGTSAGYWLMLDGPRRDFNVPLGIEYRRTQELREGTMVTVGYGPEVDPERSTADAFSLVVGGVEYLSPESAARSYNEALDSKVRLAGGTTAGGFAALALVEILRRKLRAKRS